MSVVESWRDRWLYVEPRQPWAWQAGELEVVDVADPAAATDWSYTPQGGRWEEVVAIHARLVTDGNAGNRTPVLTLADQRTAALYEQPVTAAQAATATLDYSWAADMGSSIAVLAAKVALPMPRLILRPQWTVAVVTAAMQATDQWSRIRLVVVRYEDAAMPQRAG